MAAHLTMAGQRRILARALSVMLRGLAGRLTSPRTRAFHLALLATKARPETPAEVPTLTGEICSSINPPTEPLVLWTLDGSKSSIQYVSVKNNHTAEVNYFSQANATEGTLEGSIDSLGDALLAIDLNDVETGIAIRNTRMVNFVFETEFLPTALYSCRARHRCTWRFSCWFNNGSNS